MVELFGIKWFRECPPHCNGSVCTRILCVVSAQLAFQHHITVGFSSCLDLLWVWVNNKFVLLLIFALSMPLMVVKIRSSGQNLGGSTSNCGTYFSLQIKEHLKPPTEHARRATEPLINSSYGIRWSKYSLISLLRDSWHKNVFLPLPAKYFSSDYSGRGNCHYEQCPTEEKCGMQSTERHGGRGYHFHVLACIHIVKFFLQAKNVSIEVVGHGQFIAVWVVS